MPPYGYGYSSSYYNQKVPDEAQDLYLIKIMRLTNPETVDKSKFINFCLLSLEEENDPITVFVLSKFVVGLTIKIDKTHDTLKTFSIEVGKFFFLIQIFYQI